MGWRRVGARTAVAARDLARLVIPVECPGCGRFDDPLCSACAQVLTRPARRCEADIPRLDRMDGIAPLPVWTLADYLGPTRGVVVAWKDRGRADLTAPIVARATRGGREIGPALWPVVESEVLRVVPVPATSAARRRRGADLVALLAAGVAAGLTEVGVRAVLVPALSRRRARDQVGLGARARGRNTSGSFAPRRGAADPAGYLYLLQLHDRMPVILSYGNANKWLDTDMRDSKVLWGILDAPGDFELNMYPVSSHVNSAKNDDKKCIERL